MLFFGLTTVSSYSVKKWNFETLNYAADFAFTKERPTFLPFCISKKPEEIRGGLPAEEAPPEIFRVVRAEAPKHQEGFTSSVMVLSLN